jgi:Ca2+-binding RTX toxin-like protein
MSGGNVQAGSGNDVITAGANDQSINGGAGNDTITGGAGNDTVTGGAGADTFLVGAIGSSTAPSADTLTVAIANGNTITFGNGVDVVTDFTTGTDKIDVPVAATAALNALSLSRTLDLVANVTYTLLGTFNAATRVFTVDGTATASTANVATALVVGDVGFSTFQNTTGWTILQGVVTTAAADFV